jgi:hypothetical protein
MKRWKHPQPMTIGVRQHSPHHSLLEKSPQSSNVTAFTHGRAMLLSIVISHEPKFEVPKPDSNSHNQIPFETAWGVCDVVFGFAMFQRLAKLRDWLMKNAEKTPRQKVGNAASSNLVPLSTTIKCSEPLLRSSLPVCGISFLCKTFRYLRENNRGFRKSKWTHQLIVTPHL